MLATLVIGLREGLEASLIVGIIAAFLRRNGQPLRAMWVGVLSAVGLSVLVGVALQAVESSLPQAAQEAMESVIGAVAVVFVTSMIVWMHRHARSLRKDLEASAGAALRGGTTRALAVMAFLAVLKEGFETSVFLLATFSAASSAALAAVGAVVGVLAAVLLGWGIYRGGVRLDLKRFFTVTGVFLVFVAAGLVLTVMRTAHEAGWLTAGQQRTVDLTWLAPAGTVRAALVTGVLGIPADPRLVEVLAWSAYLVPVLALVLAPARLRPSPRLVPRARAVTAGVLGLAAIALVVAVPAAADRPTGALGLVGGGTARLATGTGGERSLVVTASGTTTRTALAAGGAAADDRAGVAAQRYETTTTASAASLPASLTLDQVRALAGARLPVGFDAQRDPGPFTASWTLRSTTTAWTAGDLLLDASRATVVLVRLGGGGLTTPRTLTATPAALARATGSSATAATWHGRPAEVGARARAVATAASRASQAALWRRDVPLVLAVAGALLALLALAGARASRAAGRPAPRDAPTVDLSIPGAPPLAGPAAPARGPARPLSSTVRS